MAKAQFSLKKRIKLVEQCFEFIGTGQPVCRFADSIGIPRTTLYGWLRRYSGMVNRDNKRMVPVTSLLTLPSPKSRCLEISLAEEEKQTTGKPISIDLGYCRVEIPSGCGSDTITMLLKGIRAAQ